MKSTHLVVEHAGHEDMLGNVEVRRAMARFLRGEPVDDVRIRLGVPRFVGIRRAAK